MMRNNRIFQSLGINALVSMIRNSSDGPAVSGITSEASASEISHGKSSEYNPRDDEVIDEEEVNDNVVEKNVKVQTLTLFAGGFTLFAFVLYCFPFIMCSHNIFTCDLMPFYFLFIQGQEVF